MPKRIVVCSDGTGNTAIKGRGTNVFKLFEAVDLDSHRYDHTVTPQIAIYDDGVGSEDFKPLKLLGGATGWGLSRNVRHLYAELARVYDPGDEIYMFGFSRGAFTVRTLVGMIGACGMLNPRRLRERNRRAFHAAVAEAYRAYRACYQPRLKSLFVAPTRARATRFKENFSYPVETRVRFVGVWDTVDAVGLPFHLGDLINATVYRFKFPDHKLSAIVDRACHALAIDDERQTFHPLMWTETPADGPRVSQVWFAGAHSNVGGGYPKQGMSFVALDWMLEEATQAGAQFGVHGLRMNKSECDWFREHASVDDKLYDPRAGIGLFYRWRIRDIAKICRTHNVEPKIHVSVLERIAHGTDDYSPGNLPANATVVFTPPPDRSKTELMKRRAAASQDVLATIPNGSLLAKVEREMAIGQWSYFIFVVTGIIAAAAAWRGTMSFLAQRDAAGASAAWPGPWEIAVRIATYAMAQPWLLAAVGLGLAAAYGLTLFVDNRLDEEFSGFWFVKQEELRDGLKRARQDVKALEPTPSPSPDAIQVTASNAAVL